MTTQTRDHPALWTEEPGTEGHARMRARIAGLHCSLCTGTIEKAVGRLDGVDKVAVSLTHDQALIDYEPSRIRPEEIAGTLRDIGYDLYDPRKLRPSTRRKPSWSARGCGCWPRSRPAWPRSA